MPIQTHRHAHRHMIKKQTFERKGEIIIFPKQKPVAFPNHSLSRGLLGWERGCGGGWGVPPLVHSLKEEGPKTALSLMEKKKKI